MAVFSDVHGNLPALERFLSDVTGRVDGYVCLGDVVNYGPWSDECLELVSGLDNLVFVRGNHEDIFLSGAAPVGSHEIVQSFTDHCLPAFTRFDLLRDLPVRQDVGNFVAVHTIDGRRVFPETEVRVTADHLIGHSHWQYAVRRGGLIVNPGSVGQNRQDLSKVEYALVDITTGSTTFRSVPYDPRVLVSEMRLRGYPTDALGYLEHKLASIALDG